MVRVLEPIALALREMGEVNEIREEALRRSRRWLSVARSSIIEARSASDLKVVERKLAEALEDMKGFIEWAESKLGSSSCLVRSVLQDPMQEVIEGIVLCKLLMGEGIVSHIELGVEAREYLLGVSEVVGELRRVALERMREGDIEGAEDILGKMEEIYEAMNSAALPDSLIPLRKRTDEARILIERTLSELVFVRASRRGVRGDSES